MIWNVRPSLNLFLTVAEEEIGQACSNAVEAAMVPDIKACQYHFVSSSALLNQNEP